MVGSGVATVNAARPKATLRPPLSREAIADTAMRLSASEPTTAITLVRLGRELGADPTALYRHFRNRDELMRALADRVLGEVVGAWLSCGEWRADLRSAGRLLRGTMLRRPALAAELGTLFTGGPHERRGFALLAAVFEAAGFERADVPMRVRVFAELVLSHVVISASLLARPQREIEIQMALASDLYGVRRGLSASGYQEATFERILDTHISGLEHELSAVRETDATVQQSTRTQGGTT